MVGGEVKTLLACRLVQELYEDACSSRIYSIFLIRRSVNADAVMAMMKWTVSGSLGGGKIAWLAAPFKTDERHEFMRESSRCISGPHANH